MYLPIQLHSCKSVNKRTYLLTCVCVYRPNVCVRTTESFDTRADDDDDDGDDDVMFHRHHHFAMSTVCDDSDNVYKCTVTYVYFIDNSASPYFNRYRL